MLEVIRLMANACAFVDYKFFAFTGMIRRSVVNKREFEVYLRGQCKVAMLMNVLRKQRHKQGSVGVVEDIKGADIIDASYESECIFPVAVKAGGKR